VTVKDFVKRKIKNRFSLFIILVVWVQQNSITQCIITQDVLFVHILCGTHACKISFITNMNLCTLISLALWKARNPIAYEAKLQNTNLIVDKELPITLTYIQKRTPIKKAKTLTRKY
jgi:hypothetical protein